MLRKISKLMPLIFALWALATAPSFAADYCITQGGGVVGGIYVAKDFTLPKAGQCVNWRGLCTKSCSPDNVQAGVACTASNGSHVSFGLTTYYLASNRQFDWIRLDLPGATGSGNLNYLQPTTPPNQTQNYTAKGAYCGIQPVR